MKRDLTKTTDHSDRFETINIAYSQLPELA